MRPLLVIGLLTLSFAPGASAAEPAPATAVCATIDVRTGVPFTLSGHVASYARGEGWTIERGSGETTVVRGFGPRWYWRRLGVARPVPGDAVDIEGFVVDCGVGPVHVAATIDVGDQIVRLRDEQTGQALWLGSAGRRRP